MIVAITIKTKGSKASSDGVGIQQGCLLVLMILYWL
jgi:hypothetical protein